MKALNPLKVLSVALVVLVFSSCIRQQKTWILQDLDSQSASSEFTNPNKEAYKVQVGDKLYINIYSNDKATSAYFQTNFPTVLNPTYLYLNSYQVNQDGYLTFSFIDKMFVKGLTIEQVQQQLQTTMSSYFKDVTVSVKLVEFLVSVLGEVGAPGKYAVPEEQTNVLEAIAQAGGLKEYADVKKVMLVRQTSTGSEVHYLNLQDKNLLGSEQFYLMPNDVIYIQSLKSKSYTYEQFPYGLFLSTLSIAVAVLALLK